VKRTDLAYVAGIIDGEGAILINQKGGLDRNGKPRRGVACNLVIGNTNEWLIRWLSFSFGGGVYSSHRNHLKWKTQYFWRPNGRLTLDILKVVLPYLRIKKPQAELAIQFLERRYSNNMSHKGEKLLAIEEADRLVMAAYNKRGK